MPSALLAQAYALAHQWVKNVKPNLMARNTLKYRRIDAARRAALRREWNSPVWWPVWTVGAVLLGAGWLARRSWRKRQQARLA